MEISRGTFLPCLPSARNRTCGAAIPAEHSNQLSNRETVVEL
jgi:hypothetical protein